MRKTLIARATAARRLIALATLVALIALGAFGACTHSIVHNGKSMPGNYGLFLFSYRLKTCPAPGTLPRRTAGANGAPFTIEAGYIDGPYCHGFTKYELYSGFVGTEPIYLRLDEAPPCSVYVAVPVERLCVGVPLSQCATYQSSLKTALKTIALTLPEIALEENTMNATGFSDRDVFAQWCAERIRAKFDAKAHPEFLITHPPLVARPDVQ